MDVSMIRQTAAADQLAAELRDRRNGHDDQVCDAFEPCLECRAGRAAVQQVRAKARVPRQHVTVA